jgi:hypothetical protein
MTHLNHERLRRKEACTRRRDDLHCATTGHEGDSHRPRSRVHRQERGQAPGRTLECAEGTWYVMAEASKADRLTARFSVVQRVEVNA